MKVWLFAHAVAALGLVLPAFVHAQDVCKYDTIMEKRADLRGAYQRALCRARTQRPVQTMAVANGCQARLRYAGVDNSRLLDFMVRSTKRADLRARASKIGVENAYTEWLRSTR